MQDDIQGCTICGKYDCDHLLAYYDVTFNHLDAGYMDIVKDHDQMIFDFLNAYINKYGFTETIIGIDNSELEYVWDDIMCDKDSIDFDESSNSYTVESVYPNTNRFIFDLLDDILYPEKYDFEGGPGQSSSYKIYYANDVKQTYKEFLTYLNKSLEEFMSKVEKNSKLE